MVLKRFFRRRGLDELLEQVKHSSEKAREDAWSELFDMVTKRGLNSDQARRFLRAAQGASQAGRWNMDDVSFGLVELLRLVKPPQQDWAPLVEEAYEGLTPRGRAAALSLLSEIDGREATNTFLRLLSNYGWPPPGYRGVSDVTWGFEGRPRDADILLAPLINLASGTQYESGLYRVLLAYCSKDAVDPASLTDLPGLLTAGCAKMTDEVHQTFRSDHAQWRQGEHYDDLRSDFEVLLDLMGHFDTNEIRSALRAAVALPDTRLQCFAAVSLLRLEEGVDESILEGIAGVHETRTALYALLSDLNAIDLFPNRYLDQASLAEGDMVAWLSFGTELGSPPDEIELARVVSKRSPDGHTLDSYLFRFRTFEPHWAAKDGWMAGVAGPYVREEGPKIHGGFTFSQFEPWDSKTPEEHVKQIEDTMAEWLADRAIAQD